MTDDLQKLLDAATKGPWAFSPWHVEEGSPAVRAPEGWIVATTSSDDDARLIALAPTLAARVIAAEKVVTAARELADAAQLALDHDYPEGGDPLSITKQALAAYDSLTTPSAPAPQSTQPPEAT